ncbi:hypothetical protein RU09_00335 [Microbacterium sp. MEJ108Y]|uniref:hypothetical protein n=1 Tax=Microbacterium sp. MEJ108Y TaxID=1587523 RepID=UPI0005ACF819|nr:hypothetical protein [Microbacterium sp. MEJ108Y]KIP95846.1 hypothetical protein RU09_00335 [Microbacterium sp. MEJ108Y]
MDIAAFVISVIAVLIAGLGTALANKRSKEALQESRKAVTTALWSALQEAVQRLVAFDPTTEPVGERLANLRIAGIELADEYTDWEGLDTWLEAERVLGATLARQVMAAAKPGDSVDQRLDNLDPFMSWAQALSQNLRLFRRTGYDKAALSKLRENATGLTKDVHKKHGWELPPTSNPRVAPLD